MQPRLYIFVADGESKIIPGTHLDKGEYSLLYDKVVDMLKEYTGYTARHWSTLEQGNPITVELDHSKDSALAALATENKKVFVVVMADHLI